MSNILIDKIRIDGFRGLRNFAMDLKPITVLTGMNGSGDSLIRLIAVRDAMDYYWFMVKGSHLMVQG